MADFKSIMPHMADFKSIIPHMADFKSIMPVRLESMDVPSNLVYAELISHLVIETIVLLAYPTVHDWGLAHY